MGDGNNKVDIIYIDNVVFVYFFVFEVLVLGVVCVGKVYFIFNGELLLMCELVNRLLVVVGVLMVDKVISFKIVYCIGVICEWLWLLLCLCGELLLICFLVE